MPKRGGEWWRGLESNQISTAYETVGLPFALRAGDLLSDTRDDVKRSGLLRMRETSMPPQADSFRSLFRDLLLSLSTPQRPGPVRLFLQ